MKKFDQFKIAQLHTRHNATVVEEIKEEEEEEQ